MPYTPFHTVIYTARTERFHLNLMQERKEADSTQLADFLSYFSAATQPITVNSNQSFHDIYKCQLMAVTDLGSPLFIMHTVGKVCTGKSQIGSRMGKCVNLKNSHITI